MLSLQSQNERPCTADLIAKPQHVTLPPAQFHSAALWQRIAAGLCLAVGILAAVVITIWIHSGTAGQRSSVQIDRPLPPLIVDASGAAVDIAGFAGGTRRVVVFYSSSCRICSDVLPSLKPLPGALRLMMVSEIPLRRDIELAGFSNAAFFYDRWGVLSRSFAAPALPLILFLDETGILRGGLAGSHRREYVQQKLNEFASRD